MLNAGSVLYKNEKADDGWNCCRLENGAWEYWEKLSDEQILEWHNSPHVVTMVKYEYTRNPN